MSGMREQRRSLTGGLILVGLLLAGGNAEGQVSGRQALGALDDYVHQLMEDWHVPGLALGIITPGVRGDVLKAFGYRDLERSLAVTTRTRFGIGSCSKAFTALAIGALVSDGQLAWRRPLREAIPQFRLYDDYSTMEATPVDLLLHRTGISGYNMLRRFTSLDGDEFWKRMGDLHPSSGFRDRFRYSNLSYQIAGRVVEEVSGGSFAAFVSRRILAPLGMESTVFSYSEARRTDDFAKPYMNFSETTKWGTVVPSPNFEDDELSDEALIAPSGGIYSSVEDMVKWVRFHLNGGTVGEERVISEAAIRMMHTPQIGIRYYPDAPEEPFEAYGMGWYVQDYRGHYFVRHEGQTDGYMAMVGFLPFDGIGVVVLTNSYYHHAASLLSEFVLDRLLGLEGEKRSAEVLEEFLPAAEALYERTSGFWQARSEMVPPTHPLQDYTGRFSHPLYGTIVVEETEDSLRVLLRGSRAIALRHYSYDTFATEDEVMDLSHIFFRFQLAPSGDVEGVRVDIDEANGGVFFQRDPV